LVFQFVIQKYKHLLLLLLLLLLTAIKFSLGGISPYNEIKNIILIVVLFYGCKTWSLTLREERRLRGFENTVLRKIFGPKRDEATG
jgi:hypothetical protein